MSTKKCIKILFASDILRKAATITWALCLIVNYFAATVSPKSDYLINFASLAGLYSLMLALSVYYNTRSIISEKKDDIYGFDKDVILATFLSIVPWVSLELWALLYKYQNVEYEISKLAVLLVTVSVILWLVAHYRSIYRRSSNTYMATLEAMQLAFELIVGLFQRLFLGITLRKNRELRGPGNTIQQSVRENIYTNKSLLRVFNDSYVGYRANYGKIITENFFEKYLSKNYSTGDQNLNFRILDIGGGDGSATLVFINSLIEGWKKTYCTAPNARLNIEIINVDPVDYREQYKNTVDCHEDMIYVQSKCICEKYQNVTIEDPFDIVLSVHGLYGVFDNLTGTNNERSHELLLRMRDNLKQNGLCFILLASNRSSSYIFKNAAIRELIEGWDGDLCVESLESAIPSYFKKIDGYYGVVDNYFLLYEQNYINTVLLDSELLDIEAARINNRTDYIERLLDWMTYFLRVNVRDLDILQQQILLDMLSNQMICYSEYNEYSRTILDSFRSNKLMDSSLILPHKSAYLSLIKQ